MIREEALAMVEALEYFISRAADPEFTPENFTETLELIARQRGVDPEVIRARLTAVVSMVNPTRSTVSTISNRAIAGRRRSLS
jgi:ribosomal protein L1